MRAARWQSLELFAQVVDAGSISAAADHLGVAKSFVSTPIKSLEGELGILLLSRSKSGVRATEPGLRMYEHAKRLLAHMDSTVEDVRAGESSPSGTLRISMPAGIADALLIPALGRFLQRYPEILSAVFRRRERPAGTSWRMDETYVKVSGEWKYLYRAVDRAGHTVDFLLRGKRDLAAARRFFERAIDLHGVPEKITIDKSGANTAAIVGLCTDSGVDIEMRQSKYLNNLIEQDHRAIKRVVRPMLGFKSFHCARAIIAGIETMHMIKKGQLDFVKDRTSSAADKFYSLAF